MYIYIYSGTSLKGDREEYTTQENDFTILPPMAD